MIPTAEEFLDKQEKGYLMLDKKEFTSVMDNYATLKAKFHVKAALRAVADNDNVQRYGEIDEDSILNAYPLTNIK